MARPRSNENMPTAPQRLASAFWEMLVEMPFSQITVSSLSARAHVNHNTFYYYFDSMEGHIAGTRNGDIITGNITSSLGTFVFEGTRKAE